MTITYLQGVILGLVQGVTELFPISSLGHSVVLPRLLGWDIHQGDDDFLTFLVATHLATAIVLVGFFRRDWARILRGLRRSLRARRIDDDSDARLGWLLLVATIPAGLIGLALEHPLRTLFASATSAAVFMIVNGTLLLAAEHLRRRAPGHDDGDQDALIAQRTTWGAAIGIGLAQALALIPGISRSGMAMSGGLLAGLTNEQAARFAFLLATPIIGAAGLLRLPDLLGSSGDGLRGPALAGALAAALAAYLSVRFLTRYFEDNRLTPYGVYCIVVGVVLTIAFVA